MRTHFISTTYLHIFMGLSGMHTITSSRVWGTRSKKPGKTRRPKNGQPHLDQLCWRNSWSQGARRSISHRITQETRPPEAPIASLQSTYHRTRTRLPPVPSEDVKMAGQTRVRQSSRQGEGGHDLRLPSHTTGPKEDQGEGWKGKDLLAIYQTFAEEI